MDKEIKWIRNLLVHIYPKDNVMLDFNLDYISKYIHIFNGKKIINVAQGSGLLNLDQFKNKLIKKGVDIKDIIFTTNKNNSLQEVEPFIKNLLPKVKSLNENEITFYCHSKGTSKKSFDIPKLWAKLMYENNLKDIRKIEKCLKKYPCCGILKKGIGKAGGLKSPWHFSGSFFWFKNKELFSKNWKKINAKHRCGVEIYLPLHFKSKEAYFLRYLLKKQHSGSGDFSNLKLIIEDKDYNNRYKNVWAIYKEGFKSKIKKMLKLINNFF